MLPSSSVEAKWSRSVAAAGAVVASLSILVAGASGCSPSCDISDDVTPQIYDDGLANDGVYSSSSSLGPFLHFPGGMQIQLVHHLGFTPAHVNVFFGFTEFDERYAPCAGNSCEIRCMDEQIVWVKNDTCTEFWIRVTASDPDPNPVPRCDGDNVVVDAGAPDGATTEEPSAEEASSGDGEAPDAGGSDM
jgi:hypothetical protein